MFVYSCTNKIDNLNNNLYFLHKNMKISTNVQVKYNRQLIKLNKLRKNTIYMYVQKYKQNQIMNSNFTGFYSVL